MVNCRRNTSLNAKLFYKYVAGGSNVSVFRPTGTTAALVVVFRKANGNYLIGAIDDTEKSFLQIVNHGYDNITVGMSTSSVAVSNPTGAAVHVMLIFV